MRGGEDEEDGLLSYSCSMGGEEERRRQFSSYIMPLFFLENFYKKQFSPLRGAFSH